MKILVFGYGHMGQLHVKFLKLRGHDVFYVDPASVLEAHRKVPDLNDFTHVIIATPIWTHYQIYRQLYGFKGKILIEKPAVVLKEHFDIFDNENVMVGLSERYNPVIQTIKQLDLSEIQFVRFSRSVKNCRGDTYLELSIHDLDLMFYIFGTSKVYDQTLSCVGNSWIANIQFKGIDFEFVWTNISDLNAFGNSSIIICSKQEEKYFSLNDFDPKINPLFLEQEDFLNNVPQYGAKESHELMLDLIC